MNWWEVLQQFFWGLPGSKLAPSLGHLWKTEIHDAGNQVQEQNTETDTSLPDQGLWKKPDEETLNPETPRPEAQSCHSYHFTIGFSLFFLSLLFPVPFT